MAVASSSLVSKETHQTTTHPQSRNFSLSRILFIHCRINIKYLLCKRHLCDGHFQICLEKVPNDYLYFTLNAKYLTFFFNYFVCLYILPPQMHNSFLKGSIYALHFPVFHKITCLSSGSIIGIQKIPIRLNLILLSRNMKIHLGDTQQYIRVDLGKSSFLLYMRFVLERARVRITAAYDKMLTHTF